MKHSMGFQARWAAAAALLLTALVGCHQDMRNQPYYRPLEESRLFPDRSSARPLVEGTVPFQTIRIGNPLYEVVDANGEFTNRFPMEVTAELLERGEERFNIFCAQCHGRTGQGDGMIVQRAETGSGFKRAASFHELRLKAMPNGYYFDVITNGFGVMFPYAARIAPEDRWAIVAYIRALQLSHDATLDVVPADVQSRLSASGVDETVDVPAQAEATQDETDHASH